MENLRQVFNGIEYIEEWRDVEGYEGLYQVSTFGRFKSLRRTRAGRNGGTCIVRERILKISNDNRGYLIVGLSRDGAPKTKTVHRYVAETFIPNPDNLSDVNHKDEIKINNFYLNLEWMTRRQNKNYSINKRSSSKYPGVSIDRFTGKWRCCCSFNGKTRKLGYFTNEEDAAQAYVDFCIKHNLK